MMKGAKNWKGKGKEPESTLNALLPPSRETSLPWLSVDLCPRQTGKPRGNFQWFTFVSYTSWALYYRRWREEEDIFKLHCTSVRLALQTAWYAGWRNLASKVQSSGDRAVPPSSFSLEYVNLEVPSHWALIQLSPCKNRSNQFYVLPNIPSISSIQDTNGT